MNQKKSVVILIADDDQDDRIMTQEALNDYNVINQVKSVEDGVELMDYLRRNGKFNNPIENPRPDLILLDLNMPKIDGREALKIIKSDADLRSIPIIVLTTSNSDVDIIKSYDLGVNCFISKPVTFTRFIEVIRTLGKYWFEIIEFPS
ncbi:MULTISPECIES: response regulator [unclassified Arcicella]|uniref:response regulator n=1 Tax=unclassified Arcicella TaxID=2644986 RepID=UPI002856C50C|nr:MULTISPECIES: response regulator [unclassified Arcicella]MDR6560348.1 CheY-like chemotaxis protein [Arcicella sp. BE51]MDR6810046.1 CheY-like chemotaxis protein [Arcicella sp. BE140]MDR6821395.1 CheY-like chemotaxis protein [Arcicella sp. BE139]